MDVNFFLILLTKAVRSDNISEARSILFDTLWTPRDYFSLDNIVSLINSPRMAHVFINFFSRVPDRDMRMKEYTMRYLQRMVGGQGVSQIHKLEGMNPMNIDSETIGRFLSSLDRDLIPTLISIQDKYPTNRTLVRNLLSNVIVTSSELSKRLEKCKDEECAFRTESSVILLSSLNRETLKSMLDKGFLPSRFEPMVRAVLSDIPISVDLSLKRDYTLLILKLDAVNTYKQLANSLKFNDMDILTTGDKVLSEIAKRDDIVRNFISQNIWSQRYPRVIDIFIRSASSSTRNILLAYAISKGYFFLVADFLNRENVLSVLSRLERFDKRLDPVLRLMGVNSSWFQYLIEGGEKPRDLPFNLWRKFLANAAANGNVKLVTSLVNLYQSEITPEMKAKILQLTPPQYKSTVQEVLGL